MSFKQYLLKPYIMEALSELKFIQPTPIQEKVIPKILKGENIVGKSETGSGKTHSFLLPLFQKLDETKREIQIVIISPTRELAFQLYEEANKIAKHSSVELDIRLMVGGTNREAELARLEKSQPQIVIGTLGKITDLAISKNALKIHTASYVVIDEADMVFDESELIDVDKVMGIFDEHVQIMVFSATMPKSLMHFLNKYLSKTELIDLNEKKFASTKVEHIFIPTKAKVKEEVLLELFQIIQPYLALIFVNTKTKVDELAAFLAEHGYRVGKIHGDMDDRDRKQMLKRIKQLEFQYVVASDIAARGIDIIGVSHVINFELPTEVEYYVHRSGRTARAALTGQAITLFDYESDEYVTKLKAKGLSIKFKKIEHGELVDTLIRAKSTRKSAIDTLSSELHSNTPVPKKVKPGYKKKRKELIEKQIKQAKKAQISDIYKRRAKDENRMSR